MRYDVMESNNVVEGRISPRPCGAGIASGVTSTAWRDAAKRNFILQMGFEDPAAAVRPRQYSALVFQPRIVFLAIVAGILLQSPGVFAALCAVLWWSALSPKLNPISALYNQTLGRRPGAYRLGPAPLPRRAAETEAGTIAFAIALLTYAGFSHAAYALQAIFLAAVLAVHIASFCTGTFLYHLARGRWGFVRQTLPWAR